MPQQTIGTITWIYTTYSEGVNTYASIGDGTNGGATTEGTGLSGSVTIPNYFTNDATLEVYSVRIIGINAFRLCSSLTSVSFEPDSQLETIGQYAFLQSGLTSITLPASQTSIGDYAFMSCTDLTSVNFNALILLETIGQSAFHSSGLSGSLTLPASVTSIGHYAFQSCSSLTSVSFQSGSQLETIGNFAFSDSGLTSITLPASQTSIGSYAFYKCSSLTSVNFNALILLETIGEGAFLQSGLTGSINLPASLTSIGNIAFKSCSSLTSLNFESGSQLTTIGTNAFQSSGLARVNAYSDLITTMDWTVSDSTDPPTYNTIGNKSGITVVDLTPPPPDPICFPKGTPVLTNLGPIAIEKLNPDKHTIRGKEIVAITQSRPLQKHIVCFEKDSLSKNVPSQQTLCSMEHKVFYQGKMTKARNLVDLCENVIFVPYNGETLFNVLLKKHDKMMINNLICETLHPENIAAKISTMKDGQKKNKAIQELSKIIKENNVPEYQKLYASL